MLTSEPAKKVSSRNSRIGGEILHLCKTVIEKSWGECKVSGNPVQVCNAFKISAFNYEAAFTFKSYQDPKLPHVFRGLPPSI